jgi:NAD(P)H-quinone oxidoreductase subunit 5
MLDLLMVRYVNPVSTVLFASNSLLILLFIGLNSCYCTVYQITSGKCQQKLACSTIAQMGFMIMQCGLGFLMQL